MCVCAHHMHVWHPRRPEEGDRSSISITAGYETPCGRWEFKPRSSGPALLTAKPLPSLTFGIRCCMQKFIRNLCVILGYTFTHVQKPSLSHYHPFLQLPVLLHGWDSSRDRTQLPLHGPAPHLVGLLMQLKLYIAHVQDQAKPVSPAPEDLIPSSALCSTPTYMSTHVCVHIKAKYF